MRPIDAEWLKELYQPYESYNGKELAVPIGAILANIDDAPTIDAVSVVHGKWRRKMVDSGFNADWVCSKCGYRVMTDFVSYRYCPNCGAKMKGADDE